MHSSGAYQLLSPLGSWFLWMCRRRCECGFAEGGEGNGNIPPWAGCHGHYIKPTTSSCIPVFVCHRLTPESGHSGTDWLIDASRTWTLYSFRIIMNDFLLMAFQSEKANWHQWAGSYVGHYCCVTPTESSCFGDNDLTGAGERSFSTMQRVNSLVLNMRCATEQVMLSARKSEILLWHNCIYGCLWVF